MSYRILYLIGAAVVLASIFRLLGLSINSGNGRPWIANAPTGPNGPGTISVDDPSGAPLAGPPDPVAGGVFSGDATNRNSASTEGLGSNRPTLLFSRKGAVDQALTSDGTRV